MSNQDLRRKWTGAVEWLHDELERVSMTTCVPTSFVIRALQYIK